MTTTTADLKKMLNTGNYKQTIALMDKAIKEAYDDGYKEAKLLWPLYEDESCIGGIHDD